jgi:tetratricopeptide (TPR) repeat protein
MTDNKLKSIENFFVGYIYSKTQNFLSLIFGLILIIIISSTIDDFFGEIIINSNIRFTIYGFAAMSWIIYWIFYRFYLPKNQKGKLGLIIAIHAESDYEEKRLKNDFISQLRKNISEQGFGQFINIIQIKNHISEKIIEVKDIQKIHKRMGGHFYLYGRVKRRKDVQNKYFLEFNGMVSHRPIERHVSSALAQDFISVLPKQVSFFEAIEFKGFQFTADVVYLAVKYVTGVAAYLSGDPHLAIKLHTNLKEEFNHFKPLPPNIRKIRDKVEIILADEHLLVARYYYHNKDFTQVNIWLEKSLQINPANYGGLNLRAIKEFLFDKNPKAALISIKSAKKYAKFTFEWRYNEAFLLFWMEDYPGAMRLAEKIVAGGYRGEDITIQQVEEFIIALLKDKKNDKPQLFFWLGYINYKKKNNLPEALKYFEEFEKKFKPSMQIIKNKSTSYLRDIKNKMGLSL